MARQRRQPEIIAGRVNADGSIARGDGFSVVKNATGSWTIFFPSSFRLISITHVIGDDALAYPVVPASGMTASSAILKLYGSGGAAADQPFNFIAVGIQQ